MSGTWGGRRAGAGRRPKPLSEVLLAGRRPRPTKRPRPAAAVPGAPTSGLPEHAPGQEVTSKLLAPPAIPPDLLEGLQEPGRRFIVSMWIELHVARAVIDTSAAALLRLAADLSDERTRLRSDLVKSGVMLYSGSGRRYVNPLCRRLRDVEVQLVQTLKALQVEPEA